MPEIFLARANALQDCGVSEQGVCRLAILAHLCFTMVPIPLLWRTRGYNWLRHRHNVCNCLAMRAARAFVEQGHRRNMYRFSKVLGCKCGAEHRDRRDGAGVANVGNFQAASQAAGEADGVWRVHAWWIVSIFHLLLSQFQRRPLLMLSHLRL
mgnify:CR=1 FL=1